MHFIYCRTMLRYTCFNRTIIYFPPNCNHTTTAIKDTKKFTRSSCVESSNLKDTSRAFVALHTSQKHSRKSQCLTRHDTHHTTNGKSLSAFTAFEGLFGLWRYTLLGLLRILPVDIVSEFYKVMSPRSGCQFPEVVNAVIVGTQASVQSS